MNPLLRFPSARILSGVLISAGLSSPLEAQSLQDALDAPGLEWSTFGADDWFGQAVTTHDGTDAAETPYLFDDEFSTLATTVTGPGTLSFWWKVSSEEDFDFLYFVVDGELVEEVPEISGEQDWAQVTFPVPAGEHEIAWAYVKDSDFSDGDDTGWVDQVSFMPPAGDQPLAIPPTEGGTVAKSPDAAAYPLGSTVALTATAASGYSFLGWHGDLAGAVNPSTLAMDQPRTVRAIFSLGLPVALETTEIVWNTSEGAPWHGLAAESADGEDAARSWPVSHDGTSILSTTLQGPGILRFQWKASSEADFDFLVFTVDGEEVDEAPALSGEWDWEEVEVLIGPGSHEIAWTYAKDDSFSEGLDAGWVDQVEFIDEAEPPVLVRFDASPATITPGEVPKGRIDLELSATGGEFSSGGVYLVNAASGARILVSELDSVDAVNGLFSFGWALDNPLAEGNYHWEIELADVIGNPHVFSSAPGAANPLPGATAASFSVGRPGLSLVREPAGMFLDYQPAIRSGSFALKFSPDTAGLASAYPEFGAVPADGSSLSIDVTRFGGLNRGFFMIEELPETPLELTLEALDSEPPPPPLYTVDSLVELGPLANGQTIHVSFRLLDFESQNPVPFAGSATLGLRSVSGENASFSYTLTPSQLPVINGTANAMVTLNTSADLTDYRLAIFHLESSAAPPLDGPQPVPFPPDVISPHDFIGARIKEVIDSYRHTSPTFSHPLSASVGINGSYGEWRGPSSVAPISAGRPHLGLDLAASAGSSVRAAKRGVVSHVGLVSETLNHKKMVVLNHGDGTMTAYLHITPLVIPNQIVAQNQIIGAVADILAAGASGDHLHFQYHTGAPEYYRHDFGRLPTENPVSPLRANNSFVPPLVAAGVNDANPPEFRGLWVTDKDPRTTDFGQQAGTSTVQCPEKSKWMIFQLKDHEGSSSTSGRLMPPEVRFSVEPAAGLPRIPRSEINLNTASTAEVYRLFRNRPNPFPDHGYVRRENGLIKEAHYQLWFKWDTEAEYADHPDGPRTVELFVRDQAGRTLAQPEVLKFGPEITDCPENFAAPRTQGVTLPLGLTLKQHLGPFPTVSQGGAMANTPEAKDRIKLKLEFASTSGVWDVAWADDDGGSRMEMTKEVEGHETEEDLTIEVKLKPGAAPPPASSIIPETLKITATSSVFPGIAHEKEVSLMAPGIRIAISSFAGTDWAGSSSATVVGTISDGTVGSTFFLGSNGKFERGGPVFSSFPVAGSTFYPINSVIGFPPRPGNSPVPNRLGGSSFLAVSPDGLRKWACLSMGAYRITDLFIIADWEYQLRWYSGSGPRDPERLEIGTVPNSGNYLGLPLSSGSYQATPSAP